MSPSTDRKDAYTRITETLIGQIEAGAGEWIMPWHRAIGQIARPKNVLSGQRYRGVNRLMLWGVADQFGYSTPAWGTYLWRPAIIQTSARFHRRFWPELRETVR
uniref:ArdC family protein n=1 Tax=Elstera cyanobacteriorum TaxID=2022747 RepID=UPI0023F0BBD8